MARRCWLILLLAFFPAPAFAALPNATEFQSYQLQDKALGIVTWHIDSVNAQAAGPLVVWLPGSGAYPYFQNFADGSKGFTVPLALLAWRDRAHILLVDKPGIPFEATLKFDESRGRPVEMDNPVYRAGLSKDNLVARDVLAITEARKQLGSRITEIVLIGGSEGAQYVFALARKVPASMAIAWGGNALPQYYDFVLEQRLAAERGEITRDEAQRRIEALYRDIEAINDAPLDVTRRFDDEAYRRWSSFGPYAPIHDMLALDIPLLLIQAGNDRHAPILNSDFAKIAFLSEGKRNLDYWVYPDSNHFFSVPDPKDPSKSHSIEKEVFARIWNWIESHSTAAQSSSRP